MELDVRKAEAFTGTDSTEPEVRQAWGTTKGDYFTRRIELLNYAGKKIVAYLDSSHDVAAPLGVVLIPPAYGEIKENNLLVSAFVASNGLQGLRFDWSDHVGESDGEIFTSTLSKMTEDLIQLVDYARQHLRALKVGVVATSLAGRAALRAASRIPDLDFLVLLAPVVNVEHTLREVYRENLIENYAKGKRYGVLDVLGFSIDADNFLGDASASAFSNLTGTVTDAKAIRVPTLLLVAKNDSWVRLDDAKSVFEAIPTSHKEFSILPMALHRLLENPAVVRDALRQTVGFIGNRARTRSMPLGAVREPDAAELERREGLERARLKQLYESTKAEEREFWKRYLASFGYILNIHDYWNLLEAIYDFLGGTWSGQRILDAGCGNGNYGIFLLLTLMYKARQDPRSLALPSVSYVGVDFVPDAITEATSKLQVLQEEFKSRMGLGYLQSGFMNAQFIMADLEEGIPFPDNSFDRVCCNLVVSYLEKPTEALRELHRVLRSGGKIAISSLKPNADLSEIYRNYVVVAEAEREIVEARKLLNNAGQIRLKEVRGIYHFYGESELKRISREIGFIRPKTVRSFGNQANLLVAIKP